MWVYKEEEWCHILCVMDQWTGTVANLETAGNHSECQVTGEGFLAIDV